jgi:hypothetical protein
VLNCRRILSRLRSRHASPSSKLGGKPSLVTRLKVANRLLRISKHAPTIKELISDLQNLEAQLDSLENIKELDAQSADLQYILSCIVQSTHRFLQLWGLKLHHIPSHPQDWTGDSTKALLHRMEKLAQYVKATEELLRAARRYSVFSHITPFFVNHQNVSKHHFAKDNFTNMALSRRLSQVSRFRNENEQQTLSLLQSSVRKKSRVHAEIQILLHYEGNGDCLRPRVIGSNKSACYLCHLFFQLHRGYDVPSSHGKLYAAWKWPTSIGTDPTVDMRHLLSEFSAAVSQKLIVCLAEAKRKPQDVLESRINLLAMTPSVLSLSSASTIKASERSRNPADIVHGVLKGQNAILTSGNDMPSVSSGSTSSTMLGKHFEGSFPDAVDSSKPSFRELSPSEVSHHLSGAPHTPLCAETDLDIVSTSGVELESAIPTPSYNHKRPERHDSKGDDSWLPEASARHVPNLQPEEDTVDSQDQTLPEHYLSEHQNESVQNSPVILQKGFVTRHIFDTRNRALRIWTSTLHLNLEFTADNDNAIELPVQATAKQSLQLEIQWLDSVQCPEVGDGSVVDVDDLYLEQAMPESILFSRTGLVVGRKGIFIHMRAVAL